MNIIKLLLCLFIFEYSLINAEVTKFPWIVYYNNQAPPEAFDAYNPIIFDSEHHPLLEPLIDKKKEVLGYLNLGEAEERHSWFGMIKEKGLLLKENHDWRASWSVDIRDPFWKEHLINTVIPYILEQGFTGLFFDQIDISLSLEEKYKGMRAAAIDLIKEIRRQFPDKRLMLNRGYQILPEVGNDVDYVLAETLYTTYDFKTKKYAVRPKSEFEWQLAQLNSAKAVIPHLVVFSLDYWDPKDKEMIKKIYAVVNENCIRPYVSNIELDTIVKGD